MSRNWGKIPSILLLIRIVIDIISFLLLLFQMNLIFFFNRHSPLFERLLTYLILGKVISMHFHYQFEDIGMDWGTRSFSFPFMPFYSLFALLFNILYVKVVANPLSISKYIIMSRGYYLCRTFQALISKHWSLKVLIYVKLFA